MTVFSSGYGGGIAFKFMKEFPPEPHSFAVIIYVIKIAKKVQENMPSRKLNSSSRQTRS